MTFAFPWRQRCATAPAARRAQNCRLFSISLKYLTPRCNKGIHSVKILLGLALNRLKGLKISKRTRKEISFLLCLYNSRIFLYITQDFDFNLPQLQNETKFGNKIYKIRNFGRKLKIRNFGRKLTDCQN